MKSSNSNAVCELTLVDRKGEHRFLSSDIIRMQATNSYTILHFGTRRPFMITKVLKVYEELLKPYGFVRTHHSHLVNPQNIVRNEKQKIFMQDDFVATVSRRKKTEVVRRLKLETSVIDLFVSTKKNSLKSRKNT